MTKRKRFFLASFFNRREPCSQQHKEKFMLYYSRVVKEEKPYVRNGLKVAHEVEKVIY